MIRGIFPEPPVYQPLNWNIPLLASVDESRALSKGEAAVVVVVARRRNWILILGRCLSRKRKERRRRRR